MRCTAKSKQSGERCKKSAVVGFTVCEIHGGKTPVGIASPAFKHGRLSKHLPTELLAAYQDSQDDPDLLSVRQEIMLMDAMLVSNLKKLDSNESGAAWAAIRKSVEHLQKAFANENYGECLIMMHAMMDVIDARLLHYATESEIRSKIDQRRKLVETEQKILYSETRSLTAEQAMLMVSALLSSIKQNVKDANVLNAIQSEFIRITGSIYQREPETIDIDNSD